jgi:L-lysine exporter family protein LysE/ArgO
MLATFVHGYLLAFGLILPLGPQNAFIFSQGLSKPRWLETLPVVLVACLCDTLLILLAVFGTSVVVLTIPWFKTVLLVVGICFLIYIGWVNWRAASRPPQANDVPRQTMRQQIAFTLAVSLLNPHAILDTIGVIGTSALSYGGDEKTIFALGCILNSWLWFLGLSLLGRLFGNARNLQGSLNRASALVMWVSALYLIKNLFGW